MIYSPWTVSLPEAEANDWKSIEVEIYHNHVFNPIVRAALQLLLDIQECSNPSNLQNCFIKVTIFFESFLFLYRRILGLYIGLSPWIMPAPARGWSDPLGSTIVLLVPTLADHPCGSLPAGDILFWRKYMAKHSQMSFVLMGLSHRIL